MDARCTLPLPHSFSLLANKMILFTDSNRLIQDQAHNAVSIGAAHLCLTGLGTVPNCLASTAAHHRSAGDETHATSIQSCDIRGQPAVRIGILLPHDIPSSKRPSGHDRPVSSCAPIHPALSRLINNSTPTLTQCLSMMPDCTPSLAQCHSDLFGTAAR